MNCPKCSADMNQVTYSGFAIDRCGGCQGLWLSTGAFVSLVKDDWLSDYIDSGSARAGRKTKMIRNIGCPECGTIMNSVLDENQPHIEYEQCPNDCGVFFDAGEFKDLAHKTFWDNFKPPEKI